MLRVALFIVIGVVIIAGLFALVIVYQGLSMSLTLASKQCNKTLREQISVVAEFHAYKIHPLRIAYRTGIAIDLINKLIQGEYEARLFLSALKQAKLDKRTKSLQSSLKYKGARRKQIQDKIEAEFLHAQA